MLRLKFLSLLLLSYIILLAYHTCMFIYAKSVKNQYPGSFNRVLFLDINATVFGFCHLSLLFSTKAKIINQLMLECT